MRHTMTRFGTRAAPALALALAPALALSAGCAARPAPGRPTPETPAPEVVAWLQVDPVPAPGGLQFQPVDGFPGVELGSYFVHDWGSEWHGVRIAGKYYPRDRMGPVVLATAGWREAAAARRRETAEAYCRGLLRWNVEWHAPAAFARRGAPAFQTLTYAERDGALVVRAWSNDTRVGMRPPEFTNYRLHEAVFAPNGTVTHRVIARYDAPIRS